MSIQSDVAVCVRKGSPIFEKVSQLPLMTEANDTLVDEEGTMWVFNNVKWYRTLDKVIQELYTLLDTCFEDCFVVEACHDYPDSADGDFGEWEDNPWDVSRNVSVSLSY